jgi:hypothetical protein
MGVFARLLRRSQATEEASAGEAQAADTQTIGSEADGADESKGAKETAEAVAEADEATAGEGPSDGSGAADDVEIPKQQTAEKAVDSEAGEGART